MNEQRGRLVLTHIDEILGWEKNVDVQRDSRFLDLGRYLCEVRACQYWKIEQLRSFDDFLAKRFPESRRKAYYLMSIHESLPAETREALREVGWAKAAELVKVARAEGAQFDCATWLHKAKNLPKDEFQHAVDHHLYGGDNERPEILSFKLFRSQIPVVEEALKMAALMCASKSRGLGLELICADFLAEVGIETDNPDLIGASIARLFACLQPERQMALLLGLTSGDSHASS